jgi:hypothetical protein
MSGKAQIQQLRAKLEDKKTEATKLNAELFNKRKVVQDAASTNTYILYLKF